MTYKNYYGGNEVGYLRATVSDIVNDNAILTALTNTPLGFTDRNPQAGSTSVILDNVHFTSHDGRHGPWYTYKDYTLSVPLISLTRIVKAI